MASICFSCSQGESLVEFPTAKELDAHIKSGHKNRPSNWKPKEKRITLEQAKKKGMVKETKHGHVVEFKGKKPPVVVEKPKPIELTYKFIGHCPDCRSEVETVEMDVGKSHFCVAVCISCKKKLKEQRVPPIEK